MEPAENAEVPGELPQEPEPAAAEPVEPAEPKRGRGRPAGAKDTKPRKRKVTIVEEPIAKAAPKVKAAPRVEEASAPEVVAPVAPREPPPEPFAEDSPRTLRHKTAELLIRLHRAKYDVRRANLAETYSRGMMRM